MSCNDILQRISLIAAVAQNGVIGRNNDLPWTIKEDMRFFVQSTRGHTVVTGRKNYDAMGRALPRRRNLVLSRRREVQLPDAEVYASIEEALRASWDSGESETFVIGGAQIYELAFPYAHRLYLTRVLADVPGDVCFPELDLTDFSREVLAECVQNEENEFPCRIERYDRRGVPAPFGG